MIACWNMSPRALKTKFLREKFKNHHKIISHSGGKSLIFLHYHWILEMTHTLIWVWYEVYFWCKMKLRWHILWFEAFWKGGTKGGGTYPFEHVSILTKLRNKSMILLSFVSMETCSKGYVPPLLPNLFKNSIFVKNVTSAIFCTKNQVHSTCRSKST